MTTRGLYWLIVLAFVFGHGCGCGGCKGDEELPGDVVSFEDLVVEQCDNGEDDNGDGLTDCEQPRCQLLETCVFDPADPAELAPRVGSAVSGFADSVSFLWEGDNPIVRGIDVDALDLDRVSVVRAQLLDSSGNPASGVRARIGQRPEYGYTFSRGDGMIDLVVNGGEPVHVRVGGGDYLTVDRVVSPEQAAYGWADDIVMTPIDEKMTEVSFSKKNQFAVGTTSDDEDGARTARIYFQPDTTAIATLPDGQRGVLDTASIRLTEYTVGETGLSAMPAGLPDQSAYTYALELTVDEARAAGAEEVTFSKPAYLYLDNFLGFDVGTTVPAGFYLRYTTNWVATPNGVVMERTSNGVAIATGDTADKDTRDSLGITNDELALIEEQFDVGDTFWRVPIEHFSPCDLNWPYEFPEDAVPPDEIPDYPSTREAEPCIEAGSRIECQNQVLSKAVALPGTPLDLVYRTDRVAGSGRRFELPLTGDNPPTSLQSVVVTVDLAGRFYQAEYEPAPNITHVFEWDGLDGYGRPVDGKWPIRVNVGHYYEIQYTEPPNSEQAFAQAGGRIIEGGRRTLPIWRRYRDDFGTFDSLRAHGLGGWTFDELYTYDGGRQVLYPGSGPERSARTTGRVIRVLEKFLDPQDLPFDPKEYVSSQMHLGVAPDGSVLVHMSLSGATSVVVRRYPDGRLEHVAGRALRFEEVTELDCVQGCGFDGLATDAIFNASRFVVGRDGTPYLGFGTCVYAIRDDNTFDLIDDCDDRDRPDISDRVRGSANSFAVNSDEDLFFAGGSKLYRVRNGSRVVEIIAGDCPDDECAELTLTPKPARRVAVNPSFVAAAPNGDIYFANGSDGGVAVLDRAGRVRYVAVPDDSDLRGLTVGRDGRVYTYVVLVDDGVQPAIRVLSGSTWVTIAGASTGDGFDPELLALLSNDGEPIPATSALIIPTGGPAVDDRGRVYLGSLTSSPDPDADPSVIPSILEISSVYPESVAGDTDILVPSARGDRLFRFDLHGRHIATIDSTTLTTLLSFERDADGLVTAVVDADGNTTTVERSSGRLASITSPFGQRVSFTTNDEGYIAEIEMPGGQSGAVGVGYAGLMDSWTDPRGEVSQYEYDSIGRLSRAEDPTGAWKTLARYTSGAVELETSSGRLVRFGGVDPVTQESVHTDAAGLEWRSRSRFNWTEVTRPDGTVSQLTRRSDPRFGLLAPYIGEQVTTLPSGLENVLTRSRSFTTADPSDYSALLTLIETVQMNDAVWTHTYAADTGAMVTTTPEGRTHTTTVDDRMRIISEQIGDLEPIEYEYDDTGALVAVRQGADEAVIAYGSDGFPRELTSPSGTWMFDRNERGRVVGFDDGTDMHTLTRDVRDDIVSTNVANGLSYTRRFDAVGLADEFTTPDQATFGFDWNDERLLAEINLPSGRAIIFEHDVARRLTGIQTPEGAHSRSWDDATGQLVGATSPGVSVSASYDGVLTTGRSYTVEGVVADVTRTFDEDFEMTRRAVDGDVVNFAHDADGLLTSAGPVSITRLSGLPFVETVTVGAVETTIGYDSRGVATAVSHDGPNGPLFSQNLTLSGRRAQTIDEAVLGVPSELGYVYDSAGRLTAVSQDAVPNNSYVYDTGGSRTSIDGEAVTHDMAGRTLTVGATNFEWDADGRMSAVDDGTRLDLSHDALGNLASVDTPTETITYRYGPRGYRVARIVDGTVDVIWVYDDHSRPVAELDGSGAIVSRFVYATSQLVPDAMLRGGRTYRIIRDRHFSVRLVVDAQSGVVEQQLDYDPLGRVLADTNPGFQPFGWGGGLLDRTTGFTRMGKRDYDPRSGRWVTPDPRGFSDRSTGLYQHAIGDPINFIDPDGEAIVFVFAAAGILTYAGVQIMNDEIAHAHESSWKVRRNYWGEGSTGGIENVARHCTGTCDATRRVGPTYAKMSSAWHEVPAGGHLSSGGYNNTFDDPESGVDKTADVGANRCGIELGETGDPNKDCYDLCMEEIRSGRLPVPHKYHWKDDNGRNPAIRANLRMRVQRARRMGLID